MTEQYRKVPGGTGGDGDQNARNGNSCGAPACIYKKFTNLSKQFNDDSKEKRPHSFKKKVLFHEDDEGYTRAWPLWPNTILWSKKSSLIHRILQI